MPRPKLDVALEAIERLTLRLTHDELELVRPELTEAYDALSSLRNSREFQREKRRYKRERLRAELRAMPNA